VKSLKTPLLAAALLAITAGSTCAQTPPQTDFALNDGKVSFKVPSPWNSVMEKKEGNPQAIAFFIPDPGAQGSEDSATATVKTRELADPSAFAATIQEEFERARSQTGFEIDPANKDAGVRQYFVTRGKTRYRVRDVARLIGNIAVEVRCQRPLLAATPAAWTTQFDADCERVVASITP